MNRVLLVRHAEPDIDVAVPAEEWSLTARGVESTSRLATILADLAPTVIVTSPERKAVETGRVIAGSLGLPLEQDASFSEHGASPLKFMTDYAEFRELVKRHFAEPDRIVMRDESSRDAGERFGRGIRQLEQQSTSPADVPVIVSHGRIMASWLAGLTGGSPWEIWNDFRMPDLIEVDLSQATMRKVPFPLY